MNTVLLSVNNRSELFFKIPFELICQYFDCLKPIHLLKAIQQQERDCYLLKTALSMCRI